MKGITLQELDAAVVSRLILKDNAGRAKVSAPSASDDIALKSTVDNAVGTLSNLLTTAKGNTVSAINELFTNVSNGKNTVAAAITDKGVSASGSDTFPVLAQKINQIIRGVRVSMPLKTTRSGVIGERTFEDFITFPGNISYISTLKMTTDETIMGWECNNQTTAYMEPEFVDANGVRWRLFLSSVNDPNMNFAKSIQIDIINRKGFYINKSNNYYKWELAPTNFDFTKPFYLKWFFWTDNMATYNYFFNGEFIYG